MGNRAFHSQKNKALMQVVQLVVFVAIGKDVESYVSAWFSQGEWGESLGARVIS